MIAILTAWALASAQTAPAPAAPPPEAAELGREVALNGVFANLFPMIGKKKIEELIASHPELTAADRDALRKVGDGWIVATLAAMSGVMGGEYARTMSVDDMKAMLAFARSDAGKHWQAAEPGAITAVMKQLDGVDFEGEVSAQFCRDTGKLCPGAATKK